MNNHFFIDLSYLIAAILFIFGMKRLSSPAGARSGNLLAMFGMFMAFAATVWLLHGHILNLGLMVTGIVIGSAIGAIGAWTVAMTAIPQMVALFNGVGGGAAALVSTVEFLQHGSIGLPMLFATLIGSVSFTGSLVAFGKLQGVVTERPVTYPFQSAVNLILLGGIVLMGVYLYVSATPLPFILLFGGSLVLGVLMVLPIGGADMPVVISFLNAFTGLAVAADGFVINNDAMIIGGTLVGSSGTLLTLLMCRAMNRSLANVFFSSVGGTVSEGPSADSIYAGKVKSATADEIAMMLGNARRVVIIPGYGMAVSQAQHAVRDLVTLLEDRGVEVEFAIHPVAGRMPGHMNVLLAEADIPYDKLKEMDEINPTFEQTDVAVVIGANDVVNPSARTDPKSPIAGMPILDVDKAKTVVVIKRSLSPGFAGIPNPLFAADNTLMFFHDGKKAILELIGALKSV
jgi:proton-translocating NAD(P)+ transhydrogenase subunit beta